MSTNQSRAGPGLRPRRLLRPGLQTALAAIVDAPAAVVTNHLDVVAANGLGHALLAPVLGLAHPNLARFTFLEEETALTYYPEWAHVADACVGRLRTAAAHDPHNRALHRLIGELSTASMAFGDRWSSQRAGTCWPVQERICHPLVGDLELTREELAPRLDRGLTLTIYGAKPGTATDERLRILASWTQDCAGATDGVAGP